MDLQLDQPESAREDELVGILHGLMNTYVTFLTILSIYVQLRKRGQALRSHDAPIGRRYSLRARVPRQLQHLHRLFGVSDEECINQLRMSRGQFSHLCYLLETLAGLCPNRNTSVAEQVAMFLSILAHHTKLRVVKLNYNRSTRTISKNFHRVLNAIIKMHTQFLAQPLPIDEGCTNDRWSSFQGCLGALDGTYVEMTVPKADRGRYRNRKGQVSVNILAACDVNMNFVYILSGWEGSAADARVLRDAVGRPNGLRVPRGMYYLCDSGYSNAEGFLTPYRGARYHIGEWSTGSRAPQTKEEYFNMKHSKARNVIERSFGILKKRWAVLRSPSFYPLKIQNRIIMVASLLHNFVRTTMDADPIETEVEDDSAVGSDGGPAQYVDVVESNAEWNLWQDNLALEMFESRPTH